LGHRGGHRVPVLSGCLLDHRARAPGRRGPEHPPRLLIPARSAAVLRDHPCHAGGMGIAPNFSIVTLGVADLGRSTAFYRALGWEQRGDVSAGIAWFRTAGTWIGLFGHDELAADVGLPASPPTQYRGITLALNFGTEKEV